MVKNNTIVILNNNTTVLDLINISVFNREMKFSERVRTARKYAGLSQEELALAIGCTQGLISKIERGDQEETTLIIRIARACMVNADWLEDETGPMERDAYIVPDSIEKQVLEVMQPMAEYEKIQFLKIGKTLREK